MPNIVSDELAKVQFFLHCAILFVVIIIIITVVILWAKMWPEKIYNFSVYLLLFRLEDF